VSGFTFTPPPSQPCRHIYWMVAPGVECCALCGHVEPLVRWRDGSISLNDIDWEWV
jgi:hypothetical protein